MSNLLQVGAGVLNRTHKNTGSSEVDFYRYGDTSPFIGNLVALISTLSSLPEDLPLEVSVDSSKVDFIVSYDDLNYFPQDGDFIMFNGVKYECFKREGMEYAGKFSDQYNQRFRIHTKRQDDL